MNGTPKCIMVFHTIGNSNGVTIINGQYHLLMRACISVHVWRRLGVNPKDTTGEQCQTQEEYATVMLLL